jgi:hypothetical protein
MHNGAKKYDVAVTQSGLQTAFGDYTDKMEELGTGLGYQKGSNKSLASPPRPAFYVAAYGAMIVLGIAAGVLLKACRLRATVLAVSSITALLLLLAQSYIGFPIADLVPAENVRWQQFYEREKDKALTRGPPVLILSFTWWYYGAFVAPATAAVTAVLECLIRRPRTDNSREPSEPMA